MTDPTLVLLPGLGADARMFDAQRAVFPGIVVPDWIDPRRKESLAEYAKRLSGTIPESDALIIGGASFGGMLALEIARQRTVRGVVLIGSCRHPRAVRSLLDLTAWFAPLLPQWSDRLLRKLSGRVLRALGPGGSQQLAILQDMADHAPLDFMRWAAKAIVNWSGVETIAPPVHHIHGSRDLIIPLAGVNPTRIVHGAGHVPSMSHPDHVNRFLNEILFPNPLYRPG